MNEHISLTELWSHIRKANGNSRPRAPPDPTPKDKADTFALLFKDRAANSQRPAATRRKQEDLAQKRYNVIERACQEGSNSDTDFIIEELNAVEKVEKILPQAKIRLHIQ